MTQFFLAIAGNIGSGKTTLTTQLSERMGVGALYESTSANPYLEDFYQDMKRFALPLQLRFLGVRVEQVRKAQEQKRSFVQDRTCFEDAEIFAKHLYDRGELDERDYETYQLIATKLMSTVQAPTLMVYLQRSAKDCARHVKKRGRTYEQGMPSGYLADLSARYDKWFHEYNHGAKLLLNAEGMDFVANENERRTLTDKILQALPQQSLAL